jgi:hypothetical protein
VRKEPKVPECPDALFMLYGDQTVLDHAELVEAVKDDPLFKR